MANTEMRLIIFFAAKDGQALYSQQQQQQKTGSWLWFRSWAPYCQFRLKLKKVGKTTRPFRYDLNQIPFNYTLEVTNRFKRLDLIECLKDYGQRFMTLYRRQRSGPSPRKRNVKSKMVVWGGLINSWEKKRSKRQGKKERYTHFNQSSKA